LQQNLGNRVKLNPVWLIFALFAFGYLFGFVGLLVAIPLAASLGVVLRFTMARALADETPDAAPTSYAADVTRSGPGLGQPRQAPGNG